jgi:hypothetical protein
MPAVGRPRRLLAIAAATAAALGPATAGAQGRFELSHALAFTQVYDDNLFSRASAGEKDYISRLTPMIQAGYLSAPFSVRARYELDAEAYAGHRELSDVAARQDASIRIDNGRARILTFSAEGAFSSTQRPGELNLATGLDAQRAAARRLSTRELLSRRFGRTTEATLEHAYTWDALSGGIEGRTSVGRMEVKKQVTARDRAHASYTLRHFDFDGASGVLAQVLTLGWDRRLTRRLSLELDGGPRLTEGRVGPELSLSLVHRLPRREWALSYAQTQATAIGEPGLITVETFAAAASQVLGPVRLRATPSVWRNRRDGAEAMVYRMAVDAEWRVSRPVSLIASYQYSLQTGSLTGRPIGDIAHDLVLLRLATRAGH